ncbi:transmembrane protein 82 [Eucyclogobius newberryi]|uniref:transmembrane protein 82 n=1 Tax=Eucyclogobius newberryi TaxID=166745 RepID=UPI003B5B6B18
MFFIFKWIFGPMLELNPVDCLLQGFVGACGVSVLCNFIRIHHFRRMCGENDSENNTDKPSLLANGLGGQWKAALQFWSLALLLALIGSRVSSLILLEFILRALSAWGTAESQNANLDLLLVQCQFSLGCGLTCTLVYIYQGAPHSTLGLGLAAALSWALASYSMGLWRHVAKLYSLHSKERYCGKCISLLTSGHGILATLQKVVILVLALAAAVSTATVFEHFLSQKDALKLWTPLTLCYSLLVVYIQDGQNRQSATEALIHSVVVRLGALLVLMLTVGDWTDVFHVLVAFLGEAVCMLPSQDILQAVIKEEEETSNLISKYSDSSRSKFKISTKNKKIESTSTASSEKNT